MSESAKEYVTDTMAIVLWLEERKLPGKVSKIFEMTTQISSGISIWIPAITLAEISYLFEKERIDSTLEDIQRLTTFSNGFKIADLTAHIIRKSFEIKDIPELHDRLIAGTAFTFNCPLLTNDPKIENSKFIETIWN